MRKLINVNSINNVNKINTVLVIVVLCAMIFPGAALAQEIKFSGDAKTGIFWEQAQEEGKPVEVKDDALRLESHDGDPNGNRFRWNVEYLKENEDGNSFGFKFRFDWTDWTSNGRMESQYAFGYGNFFDDRLTVSVGKLGGSPWGTGGPEKWKELEYNSNGGGMRVEIKPGIFPDRGWGKLNAGFVFNGPDKYTDSGAQKTLGFADLLMESVLGVAYTHDWFMMRFAYRLDSEMDRRVRGTEPYGKEGGDFVYRIEEYALREVLDGMQMWALGVYEGVFAEDPMFYKFENWVFAQYDPPELGGLDTPFTAQIRIGFDFIESRSELSFRPSFYWHFFNKLLSVGALFSYKQDFGTKLWEGSPFQEIEVEPKIQLNFSSSSIAFVYNLKRKYLNQDYPERGDKDPIRQEQFINLRFCIYY